MVFKKKKKMVWPNRFFSQLYLNKSLFQVAVNPWWLAWRTWKKWSWKRVLDCAIQFPTSFLRKKMWSKRSSSWDFIVNFMDLSRILKWASNFWFCIFTKGLTRIHLVCYRNTKGRKFWLFLILMRYMERIGSFVSQKKLLKLKWRFKLCFGVLLLLRPSF